MPESPKDSMVIQPTPADMADTYISVSNPTLNYGINNTLKVNGTNPEKVLLNFPISMPSGSVITAATLRLYCYYAENPGETLAVGAYKMLRSWEEGYGNGTPSIGATWYVRDASNSWQSPGMAAGTDYESTAVATTNVAGGSIWYSWNITAVFREWVYGISPNCGLALQTNWGSGKYFYASDCGIQQYWPKIEVTYFIDTTPPTTTATIVGTMGANGWYTTAVSVNLSATDSGIGVDKIYYRINSGSWLEYTGNISIANEGWYNISYYAKDKVGNTETTKSTTVKVDLAAPSTAAYLTGTQGANEWYVSPVTLTLQASDTASGINRTYYKLNTSFQWLTYTAPVTYTNDSYYTVEFYSIDFSGRAETPKSINFKIDKTSPNTTCQLTGTAGEGGWFLSEVTVRLNRNDNNSGVYETYYRLNSSDNWMLYTQEFVVSEEGIYNLEYYSIDDAGNNEGVRQTAVKIDLTPPVVKVNITGNLTYSGWYNTNATVNITGMDLSGISQILYRIDGGNWENYTTGVKISPGAHTFDYQVKNGAGLITTNTTEIKVDIQKPVSTVRLTGDLGAYGWYVSNVVVNLTAEDDISGISEIAYRFGEGFEWQVYTNEIYLTTEGTTVIDYRAVDVAGNMETVRTISIKIDSTPPTTHYNISGKNGTNNWFTGRVVLKFMPDDYTSGVTETFYRIGASGDWARYVSELSFDDGTYEVYFYSVDVARNKEAVRNVSFKIDTIAPDVKHGQITEWLYSEEIQVSITVSEFGSGIADARLYYKNPTWGSYRDVRMTSADGKTYTASIPKDDVTLDGIQYYIEVRDNAGNTVKLPSGGSNAPYFITTHVNYWYLLLLIPLILVILFVVLKYLDYWDDFVLLFKPKKKEKVKEEKPQPPPVVKCVSCNYPIPHEVVNQAFVCPSCGAVLHPACASRLTTCPNCGTNIHPL
ncbi:MAG: DNRLRE domain-containing protein [Thermoplasmata archaeon]|nr:DNRLRE domain-containing protein [Thermoplasmata archaeon]